MCFSVTTIFLSTSADFQVTGLLVASFMVFIQALVGTFHFLAALMEVRRNGLSYALNACISSAAALMLKNSWSSLLVLPCLLARSYDSCVVLSQKSNCRAWFFGFDMDSPPQL